MTFDLEFLRVVLGLISIVGGTASGVAALLVEYKNKKTGKITRWGRFALFGIAISFLIGTSNLWVDYAIKSRETRNAAETSRSNSEKTLQIVTDINRALNPFRDVRVTFSLSYPFDDPNLTLYRQRLDQGVHAVLNDIQSSDKEVQGVFWKHKDAHGKIDAVTIHEGSPLFPKGSSEYLASQVFFRRGMALNFFKTPIDPSKFDLFEADIPDIKMDFVDDNDKIEVQYDLQTKTVDFWASGILSKQETWRSSGKIVSILDFPATQLIIELAYDEAATFFANPPHPDVHLERINLPKSIYVIIGVADRRPWHLPARKFELYRGPRGTTNFVYSFPKTYQEILVEAAF
jgi:hypothetical protein